MKINQWAPLRIVVDSSKIGGLRHEDGPPIEASDCRVGIQPVFNHCGSLFGGKAVELIGAEEIGTSAREIRGEEPAIRMERVEGVGVDPDQVRLVDGGAGDHRCYERAKRGLPQPWIVVKFSRIVF